MSTHGCVSCARPRAIWWKLTAIFTFTSLALYITCSKPSRLYINNRLI